MNFQVVYVTNTGRKRKNNEDSLLSQGVLLNTVSLDAPREESVTTDNAWFLVADGMGGVDAGEEASGEVLRHLQQRLPETTSFDLFQTHLDGARAVLDGIAAQKMSQLGTTLAGLVLCKGIGFACNVGDCRVYKLSGGYLNRLTRDHSLLEEATAAGMPLDKIPKNVVTSAIMGGDKDTMKVFSRPVSAKVNDRYLICSDGLWGALTVEEMEEAFKRPTLLEIGGELLARGLEKSDDNVTFILVHVTAL